jgi:hypothetical protein
VRSNGQEGRLAVLLRRILRDLVRAAIGLGLAMRDNPQLNAGETLTWILLLSLGLWALLWVAVSLLAAYE